MGNYIYFGTSPMGLRNGIDWFAIPLCGAVGGLAGGLFSRVVVAMARGFSNPMGRTIKRYPLGFAVICGFAAAICGLASDGMIYGTGYSQVKAALESGSQLPASFRACSGTIAANGGLRSDGVVPVAVELVAKDVDGVHLVIGDFDACRIGVPINFGSHF